MSNLLEKIDDVIKQATEEKSHYYVKSVLEEAKKVLQMFQCPKCKHNENFMLQKDIITLLRNMVKDTTDRSNDLAGNPSEWNITRFGYNEALFDFENTIKAIK